MLVPIFPFIKLSHSRYPAREVWHLYLGLQVFFFLFIFLHLNCWELSIVNFFLFAFYKVSLTS